MPAVVFPVAACANQPPHNGPPVEPPDEFWP